MELDQLMGRHCRLTQELAIASQTQPQRFGRVRRLANDIAATERRISAMQSACRAILRSAARSVARELQPPRSMMDAKT
jgi:hypothetical protein